MQESYCPAGCRSEERRRIYRSFGVHPEKLRACIIGVDGVYVAVTHAERFTRYGEETGLTVVTPKLGETVEWRHLDAFQARWWRDIR